MFKSADSDILIGSCPYCTHDSFKFKMNDKWMFLCHSCQRHMPFEKVKQKKERTSNNASFSNEVKINYSNILSLCIRVDDLGKLHPFRTYSQHRKLPLDRVYYTNQFNRISEFAGTKVTDKERLVLPFYTKEGKLFGIQGRSLDPKATRYITLMFDKTHDKVFGLERCDTTKPFVVVEGPIDSFFVKNSIAMAGSDVNLNKYGTNAIICYDNEPRNGEIVSKIRKSLENGYRTVIWPESLKEKDINDMVLKGIDVNTIIHENTYSGMAGLLKLNTWKR